MSKRNICSWGCHGKIIRRMHSIAIYCFELSLRRLIFDTDESREHFSFLLFIISVCLVIRC